MPSVWKIISFAAITGVTVIAGVTTAHAGSESFQGFYPGPALTDQVSTDWSGGTQSITIPQFNSSLGTLQSVLITFQGDVTSNGSVDNNSTTNSVIINTLSANTHLYLMPAGFTTWAAGYQGSALATASPVLYTISNYTLGASGTLPFNVTDAVNTAISTITTDLSVYEGPGNLLFPIGTKSTLSESLSGGGSLSLTDTTKAGAELTVQYNYTTPDPVPEPASLELLGIALAGLGIARSQRRLKRAATRKAIQLRRTPSDN